MRSRSLTVALCLTSLWFGAHASAQDTRPPAGGATKSAPPTSAQKSGARTARGPLPDPALLDGSTQPPEKKSEHGMLGEFEIPGDENATSGKVGGQQRPPEVSISMPSPLGIPGMPSAGAGGAPSAMPPLALPQGGGAGGEPSQSGQPPPGGAPGGPAGGQNDPNAKAEGIQVAELKTDESAGPAGQSGGVAKPQPVTIGDPTRQIRPAANAPGVVGAQTTAGNTQQMEKATGGGAGRGAPGEGGNRGVEKGRTMPAGL